jgi:hypothetical protein
MILNFLQKDSRKSFKFYLSSLCPICSIFSKYYLLVKSKNLGNIPDLMATLYVKGTAHALASGHSGKKIQPYYGTQSHESLLVWLQQIAPSWNVSRIVWDGDRISNESYTRLLSVFCSLFPSASVHACRLTGTDSNGVITSEFQQLNARVHFIRYPKQKCNKYVHLGIEAIKKFGPGIVFVLGGGPVVFGEFSAAASLSIPLKWYCIETNGWSSIGQKESQTDPIFSSPKISSEDLPGANDDLRGRLYCLNS